MRAAGPVAGLALQATVTERTMRIIGSGVLGAKDSGNASITMTSQAGVSPFGAERGIWLRWTIG
jgi:hypothetical protein